MASATDTLAGVWARSDEEVVRHRVEGWTVSTDTADSGNAGGAELPHASVFCNIDNTRARKILASQTAVPSARTAGRPAMAGDDGYAWKRGYASNEQLSEGPPSFEVEVESELVQDIDVSNVSERRCLKRACGVEVHEAVLYIPSSDGTPVLPVVTAVQRETKIS